jgi:hypothetical protein
MDKVYGATLSQLLPGPRFMGRVHSIVHGNLQSIPLTSGKLNHYFMSHVNLPFQPLFFLLFPYLQLRSLFFFSFIYLRFKNEFSLFKALPSNFKSP